MDYRKLLWHEGLRTGDDTLDMQHKELLRSMIRFMESAKTAGRNRG